MTLDISKDMAIIAGTIVALTTFLTGVLEFARQSHLRRVEQFVQMRRRFLETPEFQEILRLITTDDARLEHIAVQSRRNFGGFLEEVALMVNSRFISREVAHYMFGHYVLMTSQSVNFWKGLERDGRYWTLFHAFAAQMDEHARRPIDVEKLRF